MLRPLKLKMLLLLLWRERKGEPGILRRDWRKEIEKRMRRGDICVTEPWALLGPSTPEDKMKANICGKFNAARAPSHEEPYSSDQINKN